ncbi:MAG TPA: HDOD domain-containing protein [Desulfobulbus sp.]|nr:HDOD domain-containing protein [Desulfobulbus sp.]
MESFIARQPIFNRRKGLFGYELLYRSGQDNVFAGTDGDMATARVLTSTFLNIGVDRITGSKWALINFTGRHLLDRTPAQFPADRVIVEILEDVVPTDEILAACGQLSEMGYTIALDDYDFSGSQAPLVELADIIKVDFRLVPLEVIEREGTALREQGKKLLAEKIETYEEFDAALAMGFSLFQGYFFSRPEVMQNREIATTKVNLLNLLAEVNRKEVRLDRVEQMISPDVAISYKLLRYINSAYYSLLSEISSIRHALLYLGETGVRQFVSLVATSELSSDKPDELIRTAVIRARLCELLGKQGTSVSDTSELFLLGLFSLLDAMLDMEMAELMERLPLPSAIKEALTNGSGPCAPYLETVLAYEKGDWQRCTALLGNIGMDTDRMVAAYLDAVDLAEHFSTI